MSLETKEKGLMQTPIRGFIQNDAHSAAGRLSWLCVGLLYAMQPQGGQSLGFPVAVPSLDIIVLGQEGHPV